MDFVTFFNVIGGGTILTVVAWAFRLEGRVNTAEKLNEQQEVLRDGKHADLKELINTKFDAQDKRLERIERALNGGLNRA